MNLVSPLRGCRPDLLFFAEAPFSASRIVERRISNSPPRSLCSSLCSTKLVYILVKYGGEGYMSAKRIVAEIMKFRPLTRTDELSAAIERVTPKWSKGSPRRGSLKTKARVFQAIRVAVNDEMGSLNR